MRHAKQSPHWFRLFVMCTLSLTIVFYCVVERRNVFKVCQDLWRLTGGTDCDLSYED